MYVARAISRAALTRSAAAVPCRTATAHAGGQIKAIPARIRRLIDSKPTTIEGRMRKMLELEKWERSAGVQLRLDHSVRWNIPGIPAELQAELDHYASVEEHPAYVKSVGSVPLFDRDTVADRYRNLAILLGPSGPACHVKYLHQVLHAVTNEEDAQTAWKAFRLARRRHMKFTEQTTGALVNMLAQYGMVPELVKLLTDAAWWQVPVTTGVYGRAILAAQRAGDVDAARQLYRAMRSHGLALHRGPLLSFVVNLVDKEALLPAIHAVQATASAGQALPVHACLPILYAAASMGELQDDVQASVVRLAEQAAQFPHAAAAVAQLKAAHPAAFGEVEEPVQPSPVAEAAPDGEPAAEADGAAVDASASDVAA